MSDSPKITPLGDSCVTVEFGNEISIPLNTTAIALAERLSNDPFPGFIEAVPAYASTAIYFDVPTVRRDATEFVTAFDAVRDRIMSALRTVEATSLSTGRLVEIAVDFGDDAALDLEHIAEVSGLVRSDVVDIFTSRTYRVFMLGFLPGFAYMGEIDERIAVPRHSSPRTHVPKGSVGIAGRQTGVYPVASPGGWQIIGRTDVEMFDPRAESPCLLKPGDDVRFVPI